MCVCMCVRRQSKRRACLRWQNVIGQFLAEPQTMQRLDNKIISYPSFQPLCEMWETVLVVIQGNIWGNTESKS